MPLTIGSRLGRYEIVAALGAGGMGEVYRARDDHLGREVALKLLPAAVAADPRRLALFEQEARTVAALNHPNIVTLHTLEEESGKRFLTMELIEGQGLDRLIVPGGLPIDRVIELGVVLAEALEAAHDKGVVHRDLKPANVMLSREGRLKVLDFGLAALETRATETDLSLAATLLEPLPFVGKVVGTVPYMAPEQVRGEALDTRADLFAFGAILYELLCGQRPFRGSTRAAIMSAILHQQPPPLAENRPDVPQDLIRIIDRCLEKNAADRFATTRDLVSLLRQVRANHGDTPRLRLEPPVPSTPLLGRERMLEAAERRLREGARVLTVSGYGGTGKTRLAIELFRRLEGGYPGGAAYVSLASVTFPAEVLPTVATSLSIPEAPGRSSLDALRTVIGERRVLVVLDNFEQVLAAAEDIATLVSHCPGLQCIVTSRAPLRIGAEVEFSLAPLDYPAADVTSLEILRTYPSIELFLQRAMKIKPDFELTEMNAGAIASICRRLDGLPLALELAAARVRSLEPAALLQRLDRALDLLTSGDRDLPLRQRTLRATISWSYSLLGASEQRLLRRLSNFHEGWTLEALEHVCYSDGERHRAIDELDSLVEKGLVRLEASGERYALLETIRAFSAEQLHASGEVDGTRDAHADYFVGFAALLAADLRTTAQLQAMERGHGDNANMHAAIQWLTASARAGDGQALEKGLLLCGCLNWFWHLTAQHSTARVALDTLLHLAADRPASRGRALAWLAAGMVSTTTGEWERSLREWRSGFEDAEAVGDSEAAAEGLMGVGYCGLSLGRMAEASDALDQAIARASGISDFLHALSLCIKGMQRFVTGSLEEGMALVEEALRVQNRIGDYEGGGVARSFLAQMTFARGDPVGALELYRGALTAFKTVGDDPEIARVHCEMGWTALSAASPEAALDCFRKAVHAYERVGSPRGIGLALLGIAAVEAAEGRAERAVLIAAAANNFSRRAGVVVDHPMDPTVVERIEALQASIPQDTLDNLMARSDLLTPAAVLEMLAELGSTTPLYRDQGEGQ